MDEVDRGRQRFKVTPAVFVIVLDTDNRVLLQCRANTHYMDGYYDFPSGHVEAGETLLDAAIRETQEEVGLIIARGDLTLVHINQNSASAELPYLSFMFKAERWQGAPQRCEPHKCSDVGFFPLTALPKVTPQVREALRQITAQQLTFSYFTERDFTALD